MSIIKGYQPIAQIYESAETIVYRGIRQEDNKAVILKMLKQDHPTPAELTRYKQEYEINRQLNYIEGIAKAYNLYEVQKTLVIIFEDFGGESLKKLMDNRVGTKDVMSLLEFLPIAVQTAEILGKIHAANVIHKDINPGNIVFNSETRQVKIIDFGIATLLSRENPTLRNPNVLEGTLAYISPEQTGRMNRALDYRTDFYSLGVTFYKLLTGKLPFETTDTLELLHCHIAKQPVAPHELNAEIPQAVSHIVMKLMAKTAEQRYQSAWGLKTDLEECLNQWQTTGKIDEFSLGTQDIFDKFQIPQKLYGREAQVQAILAAFARVAVSGPPCPQSRIEMMVVTGYSGIGKSVLVAEIHKPITQARGYFIAGKFDQYQRDIPYSAVAQAFQGLVRQLLTETEEQLNQWRKKLLAALAPNGQIIIDVIPEVELIIGQQPPVPELGATESQNRFHLVFGKFIRVFAKKEHPLVIFLDDLQWADSATLKLIELMMTDTDTQYLFLIGAYRDNEDSGCRTLMMTLEDIRKAGVTINQIALAPLDLEHVSYLIADTLHTHSSSVQPLAELVVRKTGGNPFFVNEFLKTLHAENLLKFNPPQSPLINEGSQGGWQWNISQIEAIGITDNVVELMIGKLKKLPESTQKILCLAACIGAEFSLSTLAIICKKTPVAIFLNLKAAIQAELILPLSELDSQLLIQDYQFRHDRIQQAACTLIDEFEKKDIHLQIGRLLLQDAEPEFLAEKIFKIVDHFNFSIQLLSCQQEIYKVAKLNLIAGERAKASTAYETACKYFNTGLQLLPIDSWKHQYQLTLKLHDKAVEAGYLNTNFEEAENLVEVIIQRAKSKLDAVKAYELKIQLYTARNLPTRALKTGLQALELLEISLSKRQEWSIELPALTDLDKLPEMTDAAQLAAMRVLMSICPSAYFAKPKVLKSIVLTMVNLTRQHGYSSLAAYAYVWYAAISSALGEIEIGYHAGKLALKLVDKYHAQELKAKVINLFSVLVRHWKESAKNSIKSLREGIESGINTGDNEYACYCIKDYCVSLFLTGQPLEVVNYEMVKANELLLKFKQEYSICQTNIWRQVVGNFLGKESARSQLLGDYCQEEEIIPRLLVANNRTLLCIVYLAKLNLSYLFRDYDRALENAIAAAEYIDAVMGFMYVVIHNFYDSLTRLARYSPEQAESLYQIELNQAQMQKWAELAPANFQHKYDLVKAEIARVLGQNWQAAELYERAIQGARDNGYLQEEALACELAAEFYLARRMDAIAQTYLKEAYSNYTRWQAWAKIEDLLARHPQLITKSSTTARITDTSTTITIAKTTARSGLALDLATVIKASQAISSEIVLEKLLHKLMKILLENAGAQVGYLILKSQDKLLIEAEGAVDSEQVTVLQSIPIETSQSVSSAIVNYVARTKESVVLHDAVREGNFTDEPYIQEHQPKSILCVPLSERGKLVSIVYLENNLLAGAFTPERIEILTILSAQAAISIEKARLYQTLEDKVKERTTQLAEANAEISALNELLKAENLRMSAELDVARQLQRIVLPKQSELDAIEELEIAGFMESADEVGGDYYDVIQRDDRIAIGIGDVTGHGLSSGVLMLMAQAGVRALLAANEQNPSQFFNALNQAIYQNAQRLSPGKNLTLALIKYQDGRLYVSGQHEEVLVVRAGGEVERIDTVDLGFPLGMIANIADLVAQTEIQLHPGDGVVLYTDGITEAEDANRNLYGLERLIEIVHQNWQRPAKQISQAVVEDVRSHIGKQRIYDDITLVILKKK